MAIARKIEGARSTGGGGGAGPRGGGKTAAQQIKARGTSTVTRTNTRIKPKETVKTKVKGSTTSKVKKKNKLIGQRETDNAYGQPGASTDVIRRTSAREGRVANYTRDHDFGTLIVKGKSKLHKTRNTR